jgi:2-hydroxy-4-carboxymuconate semialdehyde hemiacetal dehydrogenase
MTSAASVRIGMLGHGAIAAEHAEAFRLLGCPLVTVMGPDRDEARKFALEYGFARFTDSVEDVVNADDVDAVVIASPSAVHSTQASAALGRGKHVLCEVPLGLTLADVLAVQAASTGRLICMVCHTQRYLAPVRRLRRRITDGQLQPLSLATTMAMYRRENVGWSGRPRTWADDLVWHHGTHAIDTALWLLDDEAAEVQATSGRPHPQTGAPMDLAVAIRTRTGRLATLALSYNALTPVNELVLVAESETVRLRDWQVLDAHGEPDAELSAGTLGDGVHSQAAAFLQAIQGERQDVPTVDEVLPIYRTVGMVADEITLQLNRSQVVQ